MNASNSQPKQYGYDEIIKEYSDYFGYNRATRNINPITAYRAMLLLIENGCKVICERQNYKVWELLKK